MESRRVYQFLGIVLVMFSKKEVSFFVYEDEVLINECMINYHLRVYCCSQFDQ
jgi:hypothetical protein